MAEPWMKFYPRDWRGDQALRAVSIAARGLWMECLCIMHEAKPYGHLVLNGEPVGGDTLARMTGVSVDEVSALIAELRQAGVLSVTGKGVVFSRRMTKDHARAQKGRKAANKRWSQVSDDVEQSDAPIGLPNGSPTTQKPDTRSQKEIEPIAQRSMPRGEKVLDQLLEAAGVKGNPPPGLAFTGELLALIPAGYDFETEILPAIRSKPNPNVRSWSYYVPIVRERVSGARTVAAEHRPDPLAALRTWTADKWQRVLEHSRQRREWSSTYGPAPGEPGCLVPRHLLEPSDQNFTRVAA